MRTVPGIESSQRIEAMKYRIGMSGYVESRLDGAIDRLIASGDLATESTPRQDQPLCCCDCGRELVKAAPSEVQGVRCGTCWSLVHDAEYPNAMLAIGLGMDPVEVMGRLERSREADPRPAQLSPDIEGVIERRLREDEQGAAMEGDRWE